VLVSGRYGYFVDEQYYLACSHHLDWGYVDQAPLITVVTWLERVTLGDSLPALRFLPALAAGPSNKSEFMAFFKIGRCCPGQTFLHRVPRTTGARFNPFGFSEPIPTPYRFELSS
jgi:hypothetical protein